MPEDERTALRQSMRQRRRALDAARQREASLAVCAHLAALPCLKQAQAVMAYMACGGEISLLPLMEQLLAGGRALALPRCEGPGRMTARLVRSLDALIPGDYGIPAPGADCPMLPAERIDLILVPGTAFGRDGGRIGQGGGYYDRYLPQTDALRVGICHDFALLERVPAQAHDQRMDLIVTPSGVTGMTGLRARKAQI
ncbi:MAG: 5-formyltetrahydrofolate cyclo-ligase [Clostridiales bacterium]|nr:5-formyltetrahydrofolate cyclo-ligase [Clostridiales bacterium]